MSNDLQITPDERLMLGEEVRHSEERAPLNTMSTPSASTKDDFDSLRGPTPATPEDAEQTFQRTKQEIDGMVDDNDEAKKLEGLQDTISASTDAAAAAAAATPTTAGQGAGAENPKAADETSVYVGQVDYEATPDELQSHFEHCGTINRVTILCDKFNGRPKGYAYIEFVDKDGVVNALSLDNSLFKGRNLKVTQKRTNVPGMSIRARGRGRGRSAGYGGYYPVRGRGRGRTGFRPPYRGGGYRGGFHHYNNYY